MLRIDLAVLLAAIVIYRVKRAVEPRTRADQLLGVTVILVLGLLLAPTDLGQGVLDVVRQLAAGLADAAR